MTVVGEATAAAIDARSVAPPAMKVTASWTRSWRLYCGIVNPVISRNTREMERRAAHLVGEADEADVLMGEVE